MADLSTVCAFFCSGLSAFGIIGLVIFGMILKSGGAWYLSVKEENAQDAASGCFVAAGLYFLLLLGCGYRALHPPLSPKSVRAELLGDRRFE